MHHERVDRRLAADEIDQLRDGDVVAVTVEWAVRDQQRRLHARDNGPREFDQVGARIRRAMVATMAACSEGSARVSSSELVCSDCTPPSTPASACTATRTMLLRGCCAVSEQPAVWAWVLRRSERGSRAPKRSRMRLAHSRRAARSFATSSRKSLWRLKKKDSRDAKSSTAMPRARAAST